MTTRTPAELINEPAHKVLAEFITNCSDDPETRQATVSALALSFWQMAARGISPQLPSIILVNAGGEEDDPVLGAVHRICNHTRNKEQEEVGAGTSDGRTREQDLDTMLKAGFAEQGLRVSPGPASSKASWVKIYNDARVAGYGDGRSSTYTGAWHPQMGLISDEKNSIILHLDEESDWKAYRRDLLQSPAKLQDPAGINTELNLIVKSLAVSGSIEAAQFDEKTVDAVLKLGRPYLFLPHVAQEPITIPNFPALSYYSLKLDKTTNMLVTTCPLLPNSNWISCYQNWIWKRLGQLPPNYRFPTMEILHQIQSVCQILARCAGPDDGEQHSNVDELARNLFTTLLRSMALSLAFLAWHCHGIELSCSIRSARKVLTLLREDGGSMSLRDLQRGAGFGTAAKRDEVIKQLGNQGLVILDDKFVSAATMPEFITSIREQLPVA